MRDIYRLLYDFNADIVINGHDHLYERFAPQDAGRRRSTDARDPAVHRRHGRRAAVTNPFMRKANSEVHPQGLGRAEAVTARNGRYDWDFIPVRWRWYRDSGSGVVPLRPRRMPGRVDHP